MKYTYNFNNGNCADVYVSSEDSDLEVTVVLNGKSRDYVIQKDEDGGKFFKIKKNKIRLKDLQKVTKENLIKNLDNGKGIAILELDQVLSDCKKIALSYSIDGSTFVDCTLEKNDKNKTHDCKLSYRDNFGMTHEWET